MAPELQRNEAYTEKADLWSIGVILFEMVAGTPPFIAQTRDLLKQAIDRGVIRFPPNVKLSLACQNLIYSLLIQDAHKRIEWADFFNHPFIEQDNKTFEKYYNKEMQIHVPKPVAEIQLVIPPP